MSACWLGGGWRLRGAPWAPSSCAPLDLPGPAPASTYVSRHMFMRALGVAGSAPLRSVTLARGKASLM